MKHINQIVNKKYDRCLLSYKKEKRVLEQKQKKLKEYDLDTRYKEDVECFRVEYLYSSLMIKRKFEDVFFDTYVHMFDYWYDLTYLQRKYQMNVEIDKLKNQLVSFEYDGKPIYMPGFSPWLNGLYANEIVLLDLKQYHTFIRDCKKETADHLYGYHIYDHGFTSVCVCAHDSLTNYVLFHPVTKRFYVFKEDHLIEEFSLNPKLETPSDEILAQFAKLLLKQEEEAIVAFILEHELYSKRMLKKIRKYQKKFEKRRKKENEE